MDAIVAGHEVGVHDVLLVALMEIGGTFTEISRPFVNGEECEVIAFVDPVSGGVDLASLASFVEIPFADGFPVGGIPPGIFIGHGAMTAKFVRTACSAEIGTCEEAVEVGGGIPEDLVVGVGGAIRDRTTFIEGRPCEAIGGGSDAGGHTGGVVSSDESSGAIGGGAIEFDGEGVISREGDAGDVAATFEVESVEGFGIVIALGQITTPESEFLAIVEDGAVEASFDRKGAAVVGFGDGDGESGEAGLLGNQAIVHHELRAAADRDRSFFSLERNGQ